MNEIDATRFAEKASTIKRQLSYQGFSTADATVIIAALVRAGRI